MEGIVIFSVVISGLFVISVWVITNLLRKVEVYEDVIFKLEGDYQELQTFLVEVSGRLSEDLVKLKEVDRKGSFESDDEVGFIFNTIRRTAEDSYLFVSKMGLIEEEDGEKEEEEQQNTLFYK